MPTRHRSRSRSVAILLALSGAAGVFLGRASPLFAQAGASSAQASSEVTGFVIDIQGDELFLDIGSNQGLSSGDKVEIWRPLKLTHPVTGKLFNDRFLIGTLEVAQVRPSISLSKAIGTLTRDAQKGDIIIAPGLTKSAPAAPVSSPASASSAFLCPPTTPCSPGSSSGGPAEDREAAALTKMIESLRGADPAKRIRVYEDYVRTQPKGRFAVVLYEEAQNLRRIFDLERERDKERASARDRAGRAAAKDAAKDQVRLVSFSRVKEAVGGRPLHLSVELTDNAVGAVLHVRPKGNRGYTSFPMATMDNGFFRATIPADQMVGSDISYFIEAVDDSGRVSSVVGGAGAAEVIEIAEPPQIVKPKKRDAMVSISTDYADYNVGQNNDWAWQTEGFFQLRYNDTGFRALRSGFGVYRGMGGTVRDLDELHLKPRRVGLTYGYLETELGAHRSFSFIGRMVIGLDEDGIAGGGQLLIRIGNDKDTNLILGGELLGGIGLRGISQLELNTFRRFPMVFRIEVTNQPAGASVSDSQSQEAGVSFGSAEVGGRGIAQVGYRILDPLVVSVRGSFQGRTIKHAGPGAGAAVSYQW